MTQEEYEADLAKARIEGFAEARELVGKLTEAGLAMAGLTGALIGQQQAAVTQLEELRRRADASRAKPTEPEPE